MGAEQSRPHGRKRHHQPQKGRRVHSSRGRQPKRQATSRAGRGSSKGGAYFKYARDGPLMDVPVDTHSVLNRLAGSYGFAPPGPPGGPGGPGGRPTFGQGQGGFGARGGQPAAKPYASKKKKASDEKNGFTGQTFRRRFTAEDFNSWNGKHFDPIPQKPIRGAQPYVVQYTEPNLSPLFLAPVGVELKPPGVKTEKPETAADDDDQRMDVCTANDDDDEMCVQSADDDMDSLNAESVSSSPVGKETKLETGQDNDVELPNERGGPHRPGGPHRSR